MKIKTTFVILCVLLLAPAVFFIPKHNKLHEYQCFYKLGHGRSISLLVASYNKAKLQKTVGTIKENWGFMCGKNNKQVLGDSLMMQSYNRDERPIKYEKLLMMRASTTNSGYYRETAFWDEEVDLIVCNYRRGMYLCSTSIFPEKYGLTACPATQAQAAVELPECYFIEFPFEI